MKIYEFMQPTVANEAVGTALRGIASVAGQAVNTALGTNIGGTAAGARAAPGFTDTAAAQANQGMIKQLAQEQSELWAQSLQAALRQSGSPYMSQLNQANLEKIARDMVNRTLDRTAINNYQQLAGVVDTSKTAEARVLQKNIDNLVLQLAKTAVSPTIRSSELQRENIKIWTQLAEKIAQTQNLATFHRKQLATMPGNTGAANPQLQAAMKATGINAATLAKLNAVVKQSGQRLNITTTGSATVDALLKAAKLI
jgi:ribosomal protein L20